MNKLFFRKHKTMSKFKSALQRLEKFEQSNNGNPGEQELLRKKILEIFERNDIAIIRLPSGALTRDDFSYSLPYIVISDPKKFVSSLIFAIKNKTR
jgi:hypothetical protein